MSQTKLISLDNLTRYDGKIKELIGNADTTYSLSSGTGADANKIVLTPSTGNPDKVTVPYATNAGTVNGKTVAENVPSGAVFTDTTDAASLTYSNTTSGLSATKVQGAIDELSSEKKDEYATITYAQWQQLTPTQKAEKDYYISDYPTSPVAAGNISYSNTSSGMTADDVQGAVDELASEKKDEYTTITYQQWQALTPAQQSAKDYYISDYPSSQITAGNVSYSNTTSGMSANNVQGAVDELKSGLNDVNSNLTNKATIIEASYIPPQYSFEIELVVGCMYAITCARYDVPDFAIVYVESNNMSVTHLNTSGDLTYVTSGRSLTIRNSSSVNYRLSILKIFG